MIVYSAAFFNNCGNFLHFGDTKFIPELPSDTFFKIITQSQNYPANKKLIDNLWSETE